ncbi:MAG: hypothetical protein AAF640_13395 [Pseudomonadota bacterium]
MRIVLLGGCAVAVALALLIASPARGGDPDFAMLMWGMAAVKGMLVLGALTVLWWRFGYPLSKSRALWYCVGAWLASATTVLIAQRAFLPAAIVLFHAGEFMMLLTAWRDDHVTLPTVGDASHSPESVDEAIADKTSEANDSLADAA